MTWYLYKHPSGAAELTEFPISPQMRPDLLFMGSYEENPPNVSMMEFDSDNRLRSIIPEWILNRRQAYPDIGDQLDALWKEIGPNLKTPEAREIYDRVQEVKEVYKPQPRMGTHGKVNPQRPPPMPVMEKLPELPVNPEHDHRRFPNGQAKPKNHLG